MAREGVGRMRGGRGSGEGSDRAIFGPDAVALAEAVRSPRPPAKAPEGQVATSIAYGLVVGMATFFAFAAGRWEPFPVAAAIAGVLLWVDAGYGRPPMGMRTTLDHAVVCGGIASGVFFAARIDLNRLDAPLGSWRYHELLLSDLYFTPALAAGACALWAVSVCQRIRVPPRADPLLRHVATAAMAIAFALVGAAGIRRARHVAPAAYADALPVLATVEAPRGRDDPRWEAAKGPVGPWMDRTTNAGPLRVRVTLYDDGPQMPTRLGPMLVISESGEVLDPCFAAGHWPVTVRRDEAHGLVVAEAGHGDRCAFDAKTLKPIVRPDVTLVADSLAPPLGWTISGALGLLAAVFLRLRRTTARELLARRAQWVEGSVDETGHVTLANGRALRLEEGYCGPVVVTELLEGRDGAYRSAAVASRIVRASAAELEEACRAVGGREAFAIAILALTSAPLAAAWSAGLLG
jgi:hypothetical protein